MNGAEALVRTLVGSGVDVCFTNPGTSEMYFVEALDRVSEMRCVLCLFENVATGAADGYGRMMDKPASTLLHLGPGLANGFSNLHNAARAFSPIVNIVGEHATYHKRFDAPLTSDIEGIASRVSDWVGTSSGPESIALDAARAVYEASTAPGRIASLVAPADATWLDGAEIAPPMLVNQRSQASEEAIAKAAQLVANGEPTLLLLTGRALRADALEMAGRIARKHGNVQVMAQTSNGRIERGHGRFPVERVPYPVQQALDKLSPFRSVILVGAKEPVAFFAYPGRPSGLLPEGTVVHRMATIADDAADALGRLASKLGATEPALVEAGNPPAAGTGPLTAMSLAAALGASLPANAIVVDESVSVGRGFYNAMRASPPHDWLQVTGGSIGDGLPLAVGAAVACPGRRIVCLEGDGSAMYTNQAFWTMARENLDVTTVILDNSSYAILHGEFAAITGGKAGARASRMLDLDGPRLDWPSIAGGMGVPCTRVSDVEGFVAAFTRANSTPGPHVIDAVISA